MTSTSEIVGEKTVIPGMALVPKLKYEHVYLTTSSKLRVNLAAQVHVHGMPLFMYELFYLCR